MVCPRSLSRIVDRVTLPSSSKSTAETRGLVLASSRHPRANGQVERVHSVVMAALMTEGSEPDGWDQDLPRIQRYLNNSESKVTSRTPFELLHGYRPRFRLGTLRAVSKTADEWTMPEELW